MKIYISGRITGLNQHVAFGLFDQAEKFLAAAGHTPINPMRLEHKHTGTWEEFMIEDIKALLTCEGIFMLPNWGQSAGARIEYTIAREREMKVMFQEFPGSVSVIEQK